VALSRTTALLTNALQVVQLTGLQDLASLEADAEFSVTASLLRAHEWVYDHVVQNLGDATPDLITNQTHLERAVASRFVEVLYAGDYAGGTAESRDYWGRQALDEVMRYRPQLSAGDEPIGVREGIPEVGNFEAGWVFGPLGTGTSNQQYGRGIPRGR
jgi:hypothetical protein